MELTPSQKKTVRHQFDSFCRKILREEARDYMKHIAWLSNNEVTISELSEEQMTQLYAVDDHPSEQFRFRVQEFGVMVKDEKLANALITLIDEKLDIVLLAYFLDMTDQDIADQLNLVRRTVQYKRICSLEEMKQRLSINLVQFFIVENIIAEEDREMYLYCMEILLSNLVIYGGILIMALNCKFL